MLMIARLSLPSSVDAQTTVVDLSTILQNVGVTTLKNAFLAEELSQLIFVRSILFHKQEDLSKNSKVSKREVDKQEISLLNLWFDLSTALLEQCDDHQKLLFLAVALGTKMNHLLKNLVDFGVFVSEKQLFLALLVHCHTVAVEKTLKAQLPEMDDTTMEDKN